MLFGKHFKTLLVFLIASRLQSLGGDVDAARKSSRWRHCILHPTIYAYKVDYKAWFGLLRTILSHFHQPHVSPEVIPTLQICHVAQHTLLSPRLHSRDRNSQNVLLYLVISKNLFYEPHIKVFIIQLLNSQGAKPWFSHFLAYQKCSSFFPYCSYCINIFQYLHEMEILMQTCVWKVTATTKPSL